MQQCLKEDRMENTLKKDIIITEVFDKDPATMSIVDAVITKLPAQKEKITITAEELEHIPENVINTIKRVVRIIHTSSIDGQLEEIMKLLLY
jgi:hypothetical protein